MKKKYFYILLLFAIIPLVGWEAFNQVTEAKQKYIITNESGDRSELGNVRVDAYDHIGDYNIKKVSIGSHGVEVSKANYLNDYGLYKNIVENKDLLRGKTIYNDYITEDKKYTIYGSVEGFATNDSTYIDLNIKNKETGKIIRTKYYTKDLNSIAELRIDSDYLKIIAYVNNKNNANKAPLEQTCSIKLYKFELGTGKLIKENLVVDNIPEYVKTIYGNEKLYVLCSKEDEMKGTISQMVIYDEVHDRKTKVDLPKDLNITAKLVFNDGLIYCYTNERELLGINEEGKAIIKFKSDEDIPFDDSMTIYNNKVYFFNECKDKTSQKIGRRLRVYSLKSNKCLYSGDINIYNDDYHISGFNVQ